MKLCWHNWVVLIAVLVATVCLMWKFYTLGSLGHECYANRTCLDRLACADDGKFGVCVKP